MEARNFLVAVGAYVGLPRTIHLGAVGRLGFSRTCETCPGQQVVNSDFKLGRGTGDDGGHEIWRHDVVRFGDRVVREPGQ
jgi:hypothetical protein